MNKQTKFLFAWVLLGLFRLSTGQDIEHIVRNGLPRRLAPAEEVLALKPELRPPR